MAAILLIEEMFTLAHTALEKIAATYNVPALTPVSTVPDEYRPHVGAGYVDWDQELTTLNDQLGGGQ